MNRPALPAFLQKAACRKKGSSNCRRWQLCGGRTLGAPDLAAPRSASTARSSTSGSSCWRRYGDGPHWKKLSCSFENYDSRWRAVFKPTYQSRLLPSFLITVAPFRQNNARLSNCTGGSICLLFNWFASFHATMLRRKPNMRKWKFYKILIYRQDSLLVD